MNDIKIAVLNFWILAVQVFLMYLSNKDQLKNHRWLYLIAIPVATAFPVVIGGQDMQAYYFYEYAVIFCVIFAAIVDASLAAVLHREFFTDVEGMSLTLSYFLICAVTEFGGETGMAVRVVTALLLAGAFAVFAIMKKRSVMELLMSMPIALVSLGCAWLFLRFGL